MEERKKESVVVSVIITVIGLIGLLLTFILSNLVAFSDRELLLGLVPSCIALVGGGISLILAWTGKWTRKTESVKQKRNVLIGYIIITIVSSVVMALIFAAALPYSTSPYGLVVPIFSFPILMWGFVGFYLWCYIRKKRLEG